MGFRLGRTYMLQFEGYLQGAEIRLKSAPVSVLLEIQGTVKYERLGELLADYVTEWNLESADGEPVKLEKDSILSSLELPVLAKILREWSRAAGGITAPLDGPSTSGEQSPEESIPMETS